MGGLPLDWVVFCLPGEGIFHGRLNIVRIGSIAGIGLLFGLLSDVVLYSRISFAGPGHSIPFNRVLVDRGSRFGHRFVEYHQGR